LKIFLFVDKYLPSTKSSAKLISDLASELNEKSHKVSVITISEDLKKNYELKKINKINTLIIKTGKINSTNSKIVRGINEMLISYKILKYGKFFFKRNKCDLIIWYSPSIFFGKVISKLKKKYKCKTYLILRDIFPQWAIDTGLIKNKLIIKFLRYFENLQYKIADIIGVQSPKNLDYFRNKKYQKLNLEVLYNWTKTSNNLNINSINYRERYKLKGKFVLVYGGNIGFAQDMDNLIRLSKNLYSYSNIHLLIVGYGSEFFRIKNQILNENIKNISLHKPIKQNEFIKMLSQFDVGILSLDKNFKTHNFPGKMLGYMEASLPILASVNKGNDLIDLINSNQAGIAFTNGDDLEFKKNVIKLYTKKELLIKFSKNSNKTLKKYFIAEKTVSQIMSHF